MNVCTDSRQELRVASCLVTPRINLGLEMCSYKLTTRIDSRCIGHGLSKGLDEVPVLVSASKRPTHFTRHLQKKQKGKLSARKPLISTSGSAPPPPSQSFFCLHRPRTKGYCSVLNHCKADPQSGRNSFRSRRSHSLLADQVVLPSPKTVRVSLPRHEGKRWHR